MQTPHQQAPTRDLTDAEFEELDQLLAATPEPFEPLDAVMLDGYLCGVLVQPILIETEAWLPHVFDFDGQPLPERKSGLWKWLLGLVAVLGGLWVGARLLVWAMDRRVRRLQQRPPLAGPVPAHGASAGHSGYPQPSPHGTLPAQWQAPPQVQAAASAWAAQRPAGASQAAAAPAVTAVPAAASQAAAPPAALRPLLRFVGQSLSGQRVPLPDGGVDAAPCTVGKADRYLPFTIGATWSYTVTPMVGTPENKSSTVEALEDVGDRKAGIMAYRQKTEKLDGVTVNWSEDRCTSLVRHREKSYDLSNVLLADQFRITLPPPPDFDERAEDPHFAELGADNFALRLARGKAASLRAAHPRGWLLGADQVAVLAPGELLHKPGTVEHAVDQLMRMSGRVLELVTGVVLLDAVTGGRLRRNRYSAAVSVSLSCDSVGKGITATALPSGRRRPNVKSRKARRACRQAS